MSTQSNVIPVVNNLSGYLSEINKIKPTSDTEKKLVALLRKLLLTLIDSNTRVNDRSNQLVMGGPTANRPNAGVVGRIFFDTTTLKLYDDDGAAWHFVTLT